MLAVALDCFAADAKFFCDLTNAVPSRNASEYRHLAIAEDIESVWKVAIMSAGYAKRHRRLCLLLLPFTFDFVQRFFCTQAPTRSSAFSMFSIELATLKRK